MKRFLSSSICAFIITLSIFAFSRISQIPVYAQLPFPLPSLPAGLPNFSQFNLSDVLKIIEGVNPELPVDPLNPANIIDQLLTGQLSSTVLSGTMLSTYVNQNGQNLSPDAVVPELLKNLNSQLPTDALATITTLNPQTGLFETLGALTGNITTVSDLLKFAPNTSYLLGNTKAVPNYSGSGCPRGNNLPNAPEGTIGPMTFNSAEKYICQYGKWSPYVPPTSGSSSILPPETIINPQPQNPVAPSTSVTTHNTPLPDAAQSPNPPATQTGTCACTCSGSYKGCGPGPHNNGSFLNHLSCEEGTDSASGSEPIASAGECTISTCLVRAPVYAQKVGQTMAAAKGAHLEYINITGCSSAVFSPGP